ncbi:hypothetical protein [Corynebacterium sanguinis]|uniref:hypothetical protein n=1 Tax=Corynebacterium sanguinis TaxID=2594913 RepID=UPI00223C463C|nr:hypothetical protein [Corynebacterium sanguinis]MCT1414757.1 hypothetical protein [Corynebacterium sanguinis]
MTEWWQSLVAKWSWDDPMLLVGVVTILVTAVIPFFIWRLGVKQSERDGHLNELQTSTLERQEQTLRRQRRDALLEIVDRSSDATHLGLLWREVGEYKGEDKDLLLSTFRANVALALPGTRTGVEVRDDLTESVVSDYVNGLERRYTEGLRGIHPYSGLLDFVAAVANQGVEIETRKIVELVTGATAERQRPGHEFYRELVNALPDSAGGLLHEVERIDSRSSGGLRLNVLTGTLLAVYDAEIGSRGRRSSSHADARETLRNTVPVPLAELLHRNNLRTFDRWSLEGSTEPVSATVACLIRVVGWLADTDDHLAMRMIQNLAAAIESIPAADKGWWSDGQHVRQGFEWIRQKQPGLWEEYGESLESAATSIGPWRDDERGDG